MKTALLISGDYRGFDYCYHTYAALIQKCDVYFSTWSHTFQNCPLTGNEIFRLSLSQEHILDRLDGANVKAIICEESSCAPKTDIYNSKMIHRWRAGINTIMNSGVQYDRVVYARPDLYFYDPDGLSFILDLDVATKCYSAWFDPASKRMPDILAVASPANMNKLLCSIETWHQYCFNYDGDWHKSYFKIVIDAGLDISKLPVATIFLRPPYLENASTQFVNFCEYAWKLRIVKKQLSEFDRSFVKTLWPENIITEATAFEFPEWKLKV